MNLSLSNIPNGTVIYEEVKPAVSFGEQVAKYVAEKGGVFMKGNGSGMETSWCFEIMKFLLPTYNLYVSVYFHNQSSLLFLFYSITFYDI